MKSNRYYLPGDLYYSTVYGGGIYEWTGQLVQDPLGGGRGGDAVSPLLTNALTGGQFFLRRIPDGIQGRCRKMILSPPKSEGILWPGDLVHLEEGQREQCTLFAVRDYAPAPAKERGGSDALLFPYGEYPGAEDLPRKLSRIEKPSWKVREVRDMAVEIARALESVNRSGYLYADIHQSRLYFTDTGKVLLDFSNLIFSVRDYGKRECLTQADRRPTEFADPAVVRGLIPQADIHSQNYSLCALLFFLFLGRCPYDGRLVADVPDDTDQQHYIKLQDYHQMPVFMFDPEDSRNRLGEFEDERSLTELWEELPACLKDIFIQTLRKENAERTREVNNPTPSTWLRLFRELEWCE